MKLTDYFLHPTFRVINVVLIMLTGMVGAGELGEARADTLALSFQGSIKIAGCTVDTGSQDVRVALGNVGAAQFRAPGDRASPTQFAIKLGNCPPGTRGAAVTFDGATVTGDSTLLALDSGGARGLGIELSDATGEKIIPGTPSAYYGLVAGSDNILSFQARYVATTIPVSAGPGNATAQFTVNYQ